MPSTPSSDDAGVPDATPARPWRESDGARPRVWTWSPGDRPALEVWSAGAWRYAPVLARQEWDGGRVFYQVEVDLRGDTAVSAVLYEWPQPGLRRAHGSRRSKPAADRDGVEWGDLPRPSRRR